MTDAKRVKDPVSDGHASDAASAPKPVARAPGWPRALGLYLASLCVMTALMWDTLASMVEIWQRSDTYAHGFLIVPLSLWMAWKRWPEARQLTPDPTAWGLPLMFLVMLAWLLAELAGVLVVTQYAVVALLPALALTLFGTRVFSILAFPLLYLFFAVPAGDALVEPMMDFTADFTVRALELTGIPVYLEGRFLAIPKGNFEVAEACSGVRYLIASVALGVLYAYVTYYTLWRRLVFIALAVLVPIIANGVRAYGIVMIAHLSDMQYAVGADHLVYGWLFFGVVMAALFWLGGLLVERTDPEPFVAGPQPRECPRLSAIFAALGVIFMGAAPLVAQAVRERPPEPVVVEVPERIGSWSLRPEPWPAWSPDYLHPAASARVDFTAGDYPEDLVGLFIASYNQQRQGAELINTQNRLYSPDRWLRQGESRMSFEYEGERYGVREIRMRNRGRHAVLWTWYQMGAQHTADATIAKVLEGGQQLLGGRPSSVIALMTTYDLKPDTARARLRGFLEAHLGDIRASIRRQNG
ncbi:MAG: exosortase A [Gammaproteobacteria bacterium]